MPPITEAALPTVESPDQVRAREQAIADFQRKNETGILDSIAAGKNLWVDMSWNRMIERSGFDEDPNFVLDENKLNELSQDVDDRFRVMFSGAKSDEHAQVLRAHALELTGAYRDLGNAGFVGKTAGTLAQIASPITLSAGLLTGGAGTAAIVGGTGARIAAAARAGLITGATFGGIEAFRASQDPTITTGDVATATLGGALFGVANPFTAQSGRLVRAAVGGATQAAPGMIAELPSTARGERSTTEYLLSAASNFALGGAFAAIHSGEHPDVRAANAKGTAAVLRMNKDASFAEIKETAAAAGIPVEQAMTEQGKAYFREQLADQTPRTLKNAEPIIAEADVANLELERLANEPADPVTADPVVSFKTSKGSEYFVDGTTTTRNKSYHPEHGSADVGMKPKSSRTVYVGEEAQFEASSALGLNPESQPSVKIEGDELVVRYKSGRDKNRNLIQREKRFPIFNAPEKGLAPIEFWDGKSVHVGNEITDIRTGSAKPAEMPVNAETAPQADAATATAVESTNALPVDAVAQGDAPVTLPQPKNSPRTGPRPFTKADLENRIVGKFEKSPLYGQAEQDILAREAASADNGQIDQNGTFNFAGDEFPGEIKAILEGPEGRKYRRLFKLGKPVRETDGGPITGYRVGKKIVPKDEFVVNGPDFYQQNQDNYTQFLDELLGGKKAGGTKTAYAIQRAQELRAQDPEIDLLLHLHENLPEGRTPPKQTVDAQELPTGTTFTINDERFHVEETPDGYRVLRDGKEFPIDGLSEIPIDKGTLRAGTPDEIAARQTLAASNEPLSPEENAAFNKAFAASNLSEMDLLDMSNAQMRAMIRPEDMPPPLEAPDFMAMGAASKASVFNPNANEEVAQPVLPGDFNPSGSTAEWDATLLGVRARWDMGAYLGTSKSSMTKMLANAIANDQLPKKGGRASAISADVVADRQKTIASQTIHTEMDGLYSDFATNAKNTGVQILTRDQFEAEVSRAVRRPAGEYTQDAVVNKAAAFTRKIIEQHRAYAERHGVPGFDKFEGSETYLTRIGDRTKLDEIIATRGLDTVEGAVARAIEVGTPTEMLQKIGDVFAKSKVAITAGDAAQDAIALASKALAKMWVRNIGRRGVSHELLMQKFFEPGHRVEMVNSLRAAFGKAISKEQIKEIVDIISPERNDLQNISIARRRIQMDETYSETLPDGSVLAIEDMLVNNASDIAERYAHGAIHASMFAKIRELMTPNGPFAKKPQTVEGVLKVLEQDMVGAGVPLSRMKADLARAEILLKMTAGIPIIDSPKTRALISTMKNANFARLMANVSSGINNFAETADIVSDNGVRAFLQVVPAWGEILKTVATGKGAGELTGELQRFWSFGAERASRRIHSAIGENEEVPKTLAQMQHVSARAARVAGDLSLQSFGTDTMTSLAAATSIQRMFNIANSGRPLGSRWSAKFKAIGLTESKWNRIAAELRAAPYEQGVLGKRLKKLDLDSWQDREAASWFVDAMTKNVRQLVLKDTPAERAAWMTSPMGQLLVQLRTYAYGAWTKKFLYGLKVDGAYTATKWGVASMFAALAYMGRTQLAASLMPSDQREKYLAERMSTEAIMKAGFSRASWSSLLPLGADTALSLSGRDPAFSFARTSGLVGGKGPWGVLIGNPTFDYMDKFARGVTGVVAPITVPGRDFTQQDARAIRDALWVPNMIGVKELFDQVISGLPAKPSN